MVYFKIIQDEYIVSVGTSVQLRKYQKKHNILVRCLENEAQYIQVEDKVYRDIWMKEPVDENLMAFEKAVIIPISEEEFNDLRDAVLKHEELFPAKVEEKELIEIPENETAEYSVEYVREAKIKEMQLACTKAITDGFCVELADKKPHWFTLSIEDQTNLNAIFLQILSGLEEIPYHGDGEAERMFSAEEMSAVINAANAHKLYHLTYFNSLKQWIKALKKTSTVAAVEYGNKIPIKYQSAYLKRLTGE